MAPAGPVFGDPRLAPYRLGQQAFKAVVLDAYQRQCAITGTHIPPVLQAAHVRPVTARWRAPARQRPAAQVGRAHHVRPRLSRRGPPVPARVSPRLREEFGNGEQFYAKAGQVIELPARRADRPNREFLEWHLDEVFKAS